MHYEIEIYSELALLLILFFCVRETLEDFSSTSAFYSLMLWGAAIIWPLHCYFT